MVSVTTQIEPQKIQTQQVFVLFIIVVLTFFKRVDLV